MYSFYVKIKDEYAPGKRRTNTSATLKYTNVAGKEKV